MAKRCKAFRRAALPDMPCMMTAGNFVNSRNEVPVFQYKILIFLR